LEPEVLEKRTNPLATLTTIRLLSPKIIPYLQSIEDLVLRQRRAEIFKIQSKPQIMMPQASWEVRTQELT
jgi:hypothetical protein